MERIRCPWCGPRDHAEFSYGDDADARRPPDPHALSDEHWARYLFMRENPRGRHAERWLHAAGCRRWFRVERDTASFHVLATRPLSPPPEDD